MRFAFLSVIIFAFLSACSNTIQIENHTSQTLNVKVMMDDVTKLEDGAFTPGKKAEVTVKRGNLEATATGTNYSKSVKEYLGGSGTFLLEFKADSAVLWKKVSAGY
jgi:hypothetical protein